MRSFVIVNSVIMKKIGFLSFGIVLVIAILALQEESMVATAKRIFHQVTHDIENGAIRVYKEIRSFVTVLEGI